MTWGKKVNKPICNHIVEVTNINYFLNQFVGLSPVEEQLRGISLAELKKRVNSADPKLWTSYQRALEKLEKVVKRTLWGTVKEESILKLKTSPFDFPEITGAEDGQILITQSDPKGWVSVAPKTKIDIVLKRMR